MAAGSAVGRGPCRLIVVSVTLSLLRDRRYVRMLSLL